MELDSNLVLAYRQGIRQAAISRLSGFQGDKDSLPTPVLAGVLYGLIDARILANYNFEKEIIIEDPISKLNGISQKSLPIKHDQCLEYYSQAISLIKNVWPQLYDVIQIVVENITTPPTDTSYESASDPKCFGQIHYLMNSSSVYKWAEILAHETGHHYLFVLSSTRAFKEICNWEVQCFSSIRQETRPLIGILHAVVAESFMVMLYRRIIEAVADSDNSVRSALKRYSSLLLKDFVELSGHFDIKEISKELRTIIAEAITFAQGECRDN